VVPLDFLLFATVFFNLFIIIDPIAAIPLFLTITKENKPVERHAMVFRACVIAFLVLAFFAIIGGKLLDYFEIKIQAVQIAGGILLFIIGLEMLFGRVSRTETSEHEEKVAMEKDDVSITPLAIPLLAGPGAITAVMLFTHQYGGASGATIVVTALFVVLLLSWVMLRYSEWFQHVIGPIGMKVIGRVMGLILTFVAAQHALNGLQNAGLLP